MSSTHGDAASRAFGKEDNNASSRGSGLEHLVSPKAIREAEREEREVAIRGTRHEHPFSAFPSFMSMKHLHEEEIKAYYDCLEKENDHHTPSLPLHHRHASLSPRYTEGSSSCSSPNSHSPVLSSPTPIMDHHRRTLSTSMDTLTDVMEPSQPHSQADTEKKRSSRPLKKERLKRPPNGYLLFNRDMRRKLLEKSPKMTVAEISKEIGDMWKQLPKNQREWYMQQAALIKQDHLKNHPGFIYHRRSKAEIAQARQLAKQRRTSATTTTPSTHEEPSMMISKGNWMVSTTTAMTCIMETSNDQHQEQQQQQQHPRKKSTPRDPRGRKKKRHRHPQAPKHPMSGFLFFLSAMRPHVARQYPGYPVGPISQIIAKEWRKMSDEDRLPWLQKAEEDKARYAREMQVYMANLERGSVAQEAPVTNNSSTTTGQQQQVLSTAPSISSSFQASFFAPGFMTSTHVDGASASKYPPTELAW
ncbi:HMG-box [Lichtheimia hyalospora FSU 10163]|nr:HMG-box [Lichtheimia hyalospora FSU 10163]